MNTICSVKANFLVHSLSLAVGLWLIPSQLGHTLDMNCGPLSLTMSSGQPQYLNTWLNRGSASLKTVGRSGSGISLVD